MLSHTSRKQLLSSILIWVSMIFIWVSYAQSPTLLNNAPTYSIHDLYQWNIQSWSTNKTIKWRDGYCSLIARKNQEQLATLVWSTQLPLKWHAKDLIQLGIQEPWRFRQWDRDQLKDYLLELPDSIIDMYSYTLGENNEISNPEEVSYRSPHRFTLIKYQWVVTVLDPLRGSKSTDPQALTSYLKTVTNDHTFISPKNTIRLPTTQNNIQPPVIYSHSLISSLVMHHIQWYSKLLQGAKGDAIRWIVFNKPFQYLNTQWDTLTIHKDTIIWFEDWVYGPTPSRIFERQQESTPKLFNTWDRFSLAWSVKIYDWL
jgi:hypothetical protein